MPQVRHKPDVPSLRPQQVTNRFLRVVRHAEALDPDIPDGEPRARGEQVRVQLDLELVFDRVPSGPIAVHGNTELLGEGGQSLDVVGVLVGDEDAGQGLGCAPDGCQAETNLAQTEPRIDQDAGLSALEVRAIPGGTAPQDG